MAGDSRALPPLVPRIIPHGRRTTNGSREPAASVMSQERERPNVGDATLKPTALRLSGYLERRPNVTYTVEEHAIC